jgi:hypothetical protein
VIVKDVDIYFLSKNYNFVLSIVYDNYLSFPGDICNQNCMEVDTFRHQKIFLIEYDAL